MSVNDKDFSGFDELSIDEKLNMLYRLLTHVETELDAVKKAASSMTALFGLATAAGPAESGPGEPAAEVTAR